jgi:hypothetical protein
MTAQHKIADRQSIEDHVIPGSICVIGTRHFGPGFIAYGWNAKRPIPWWNRPFCLLECGAPEEIRTPDPLVRSQVLYPAELPAHLKETNCTHFFTPRVGGNTDNLVQKARPGGPVQTRVRTLLREWARI